VLNSETNWTLGHNIHNFDIGWFYECCDFMPAKKKTPKTVSTKRKRKILDN